MKTLIVLDLVLQTLLLCVALFAIVAVITGSPDYISILFLIQLVIGIVQMGSAVAHLFRYSQNRSLRMIHLAFSGTYLVTFFAIVSKLGIESSSFQIVNGAAWLLAILYYLISWRTVFPRKTSGSGFLPHLSF
jgi:uncharacterized membrane protein